MRMISLLSAVLLTATRVAVQAGEPGFQHLTIDETAGTRPLEAVIWYPADPGGHREVVGETPSS